MNLQERVADQFQSHPQLRVLFFFDPGERFQEEVENWNHDDIQCLVADRALFRLKYHIEQELSESSIFLYVPDHRPSDWSDYPLADLLAANRELRIDPVAEFIEEFKLLPQHRELVQRYFEGELEYKNRKRFLSTILRKDRFSERNLKRGLAAYHAADHFDAVRFKTVPQEEQVIAGVFVGAADSKAFEAFRQTCEDLDLDEFLGSLLSRQFELDSTVFTLKNVQKAAQKMKYNLLMQPVDEVHSGDKYRKLRLQSSLALNQISGMANAWRESKALRRSPEEVLDELAPEVDETHLLDVYGSATTFGYMTPTLRHRRIEKALTRLPSQPSKAKEIVADLQGRDTPTSQAAEVVGHMAAFYQILRGYSTLDLGTLGAFVEAYSEELYQCDTRYRQAVGAYRRLQKRAPEFASLLEETYKRFLHNYHDQFVHPLNTAWQRLLEHKVDEFHELSIGRQGGFYDQYVAQDEQKTAVVISDALRYEVAQELSDRMVQRDSRKRPTLRPMLAALPTVTAVGMAHLLPHQSITAEGSHFDVDGISSEGTQNRERILQAAHPDARAVTFKDVEQLSRREGRELFKEHSLVYIYHNRIDAVGDHRKTEADTVPEVEKAIDELQWLVRTLNNWNVYRIVIAADHGFLYMENDPPESMQEPFPEVEGRVLRCNRSIVAERSQGSSGYRFPLRSVSDVDANLEVRVPQAVNRYRLQGAGKRYAHGGASLQEMVVPALEVRKVREDKAEKVGVRLLSKERVIRAGVLNIQILQKTAVSSSHQARTIRVGLYDGQDTLISEEKELVLDGTAGDPTERTQKILLTLGPEANQLNFCHLKVFDKEDHSRLNPLIEQRYSIQRLIEQDDF